jgi:hypothetical protein
MTDEAKGQFETATDEIVSQQTDNENKVQTQESEQENDVPIKYSTHKKLLNQHKNLKSELEELREYRQKNEEAESLRKGEYEKILRAKEEKIQELTNKLKGIDQDMADRKKLQAFIDKIPGKIKKNEYLVHVDLDSIATDPETGEIDAMTLEREAKRFVENFPDLFIKATSKTLPQVGSLNNERPNVRKSLSQLSRDELKERYKAGQFRK